MSNKIPLSDHDISTNPLEDPDDTLKGRTGGDEYLREAGSEDENQAEKFIKQYEKEREYLSKQQSEDLKSQVKKESNTVFDYEQKLAEAALAELFKLDWPIGWRYGAFATNGEPVYFDGKLIETKYGLLVIIRDNFYRYAYRAFTISKNIDTDYTAMKNLVSQAENMIDDYKKLLYLTNPRTEGEVTNLVSKKGKKNGRPLSKTAVN